MGMREVWNIEVQITSGLPHLLFLLFLNILSHVEQRKR
jgi:hypothetical protein